MRKELAQAFAASWAPLALVQPRATADRDVNVKCKSKCCHLACTDRNGRPLEVKLKLEMSTMRSEELQIFEL